MGFLVYKNVRFILHIDVHIRHQQKNLNLDGHKSRNLRFDVNSVSATRHQQLHIFSLCTWMRPACSTKGLQESRLSVPSSTCSSHITMTGEISTSYQCSC